MKYAWPALFFLFFQLTYSQEDSIPSVDRSVSGPPVKKKIIDSTLIPGKEEGNKQITVSDYKIVSFQRDTISLDTTLVMAKEYKYNYLRKDDFELMPFANVGQPYNSLGMDFEKISLYPKIGAVGKHFKYLEMEDVDYYNVPTPMTELMFKTTFEQGQFLDALLTFNTSKRLNFSVAYTGFRSLGKYRFSQAESGIFRFTSNYETKDGRYSLRAHIVAQDFENQENGGISDKEEQFESGDEDFDDRFAIDVFFTDAESKILGKRYFLDQQYKLIKKKKDSTEKKNTSLAIGHQFSYETKYYQFIQTAQNDYFGNTLAGGIINDKSNLKTMLNQVNVDFSNKTLGRLRGVLSIYNYDYFFNSLLITSQGRIENQLKGEEVQIGGDYQNQIGGFKLNASLRYGVVGDLTNTLINANASYTINDDYSFGFTVHSSSAMPNFNYLLYQSDYVNYNWQNTSSFKNVNTNSLQFTFDTRLFGNISAKYTTIGNYTFFAPDPSNATPEQIEANQENAFLKPFQEGNSVNYLKIKYKNEFRLGKFALNNTIMYQNVSQTNQVLNLPEFVTRNTLYFSDDVFKKAMYLQTGVTLKYFTSYNMDAYNPLLGEFYTQNQEELGAFPMLDFFINAKVRQTRIFLKAEHFNTLFTQPNYYSAPNYPYRDFVIRFGLVWNFFS
ncbi:putative porin [Costertonia aggregata]|uniref:Putative porin n=1 Tax=Costertonia aggregata TaxID=343403 RepID=A0A7H9ARY3_9FLAO|nr:putative porin [Costertonia aggregata]QLG45945.1 putative porin [Costertonia aggregata]